jgi:hypothetical protein
VVAQEKKVEYNRVSEEAKVLLTEIEQATAVHLTPKVSRIFWGSSGGRIIRAFDYIILVFRAAHEETVTENREVLLKGRLSTADLARNSLDQLLFIQKIFFTFVAKQSILMRKSIVLSLPLQLVFPAEIQQGT